ncbi:hypothetical protein VNO77_02295 [Canavalia gladiata]|uniref:Uncharacterized protein n=1 Tax=Canavalia gladiata TaxID=3824 RepID=A0AAN9MUT3_CANGL
MVEGHVKRHTKLRITRIRYGLCGVWVRRRNASACMRPRHFQRQLKEVKPVDEFYMLEIPPIPFLHHQMSQTLVVRIGGGLEFVTIACYDGNKGLEMFEEVCYLGILTFGRDVMAKQALGVVERRIYKSFLPIAILLQGTRNNSFKSSGQERGFSAFDKQRVGIQGLERDFHSSRL